MRISGSGLSIAGASATGNAIGFKKKIILGLQKLFKKDNPETVFESIKITLSEPEETITVAKDYIEAINLARSMGQKEVVSNLKDRLKRDMYCARAAINGFRYTDEDRILKALRHTGFVAWGGSFKIDYLNQFARAIPRDVVDKKMKADEFHIFDNYLVMHHDPHDTATVPQKRDPILFGVILDSRKLYYIASWVDDVCKLTMEEIVKITGEDPLYPAGTK